MIDSMIVLTNKQILGEFEKLLVHLYLIILGFSLNF